MTDTDIARVSTFRQSEPVLETQTMVRARLTSEQSLAVFRAVLSAASRPGTLVALPADAAPGVPPTIVPVLALADLDIAVAILDEDANGDSWQSLVRSVTGCRTAAAAEADMVVALRPPSPVEIASLRIGTAHAPERGARLFVACRMLTEGSVGGATTIRVSGPGASNGRTVTVTGVARDVLSAVVTANKSFPAGIDTWLVADNGVMAAIPRSTQIDIVDTAKEES